MVNSPVSDFIIQLKNAGMTGNECVVVPHSKLKLAIAQKLQEKGFVKSVAKRGKKTRKVIEIELLYSKEGQPRILSVVNISKPGRRVYEGAKKLYPVRHGKGALILSTPKGILTGEEARKEHVGGEVLFKIW